MDDRKNAGTAGVGKTPPPPQSQQPHRVTGVLLLYYPQYARNAVEVFADFLRSLSEDYGIVIVRNGNVPLAERPDVVAVVDGENALREFSGWNSGLDYFKENIQGEPSELLVFANDTFCHHNRFGVFTRAAFRKTFKAIMNQPAVAAMAGEEFFLGKPYALDGLASKSWICTYLFAWNRSAMAGLGTLTPQTPIESFYARNERGELVFSERVSENLSKHIVSWLTGSTSTSWKGVGATGASGLEKLQGKANSILCEKYLSASAVSRGVRLVNVFPGESWKRLRRVESLIEKIYFWLGRQKNDIYEK